MLLQKQLKVGDENQVRLFDKELQKRKNDVKTKL
jgi:hypothetical protein